MHNYSSAYKHIGTVPPTASGDGPTDYTELLCEDFDLQLSNQVFSINVSNLPEEIIVIIEGTVEICIDGIFYAICDEGWDQEDAQLACTVVPSYGPSSYSKFSILFVFLS